MVSTNSITRGSRVNSSMRSLSVSFSLGPKFSSEVARAIQVFFFFSLLPMQSYSTFSKAGRRRREEHSFQTTYHWHARLPPRQYESQITPFSAPALHSPTSSAPSKSVLRYTLSDNRSFHSTDAQTFSRESFELTIPLVWQFR